MALRVNHNIPALNALRNLNQTDADMKQTLERLSSGLKVNRGSDGPATLVISEQMRGQLASIEQAIRNSEVSVSMVQTAEAALTEVNNLLISLRQLSIHAANEGANDDKMLAADQAEMDNALDTIDRIARTSQFGTRTLFDGSNGTSGVAVGKGLEFILAGSKTENSPTDGYPINITSPATRSEIRGTRGLEIEDFLPFDTDGNQRGFRLIISEGGKNIDFSTAHPGETDTILNMLAGMDLGSPMIDAEEIVEQIKVFLPDSVNKFIEITELDEKTKDLIGSLLKGDNASVILENLKDYVAKRLQQKVDKVGLKVDVFIDRTNDPEEGVLTVRHKEFGSKPVFSVSSTVPGILGRKANIIEKAKVGRDVSGTIDGYLAIGDGETLTAPVNTEPEGLKIKFRSTQTYKTRIPKFIDDQLTPNPELLDLTNLDPPAEGARLIGRKEDGDYMVFSWEMPINVTDGTEGYVHVTQNSLAFQVGPSRGHQVKISLLDATTDQLGRGIPNVSLFDSLRDINVTNAQGSQDALLLIDDAISKVSSVRAELGAFQKNTLESNTRSMRIAQENLTSAESSLRDADMAEEMSRFTRNQIMLASGVAMLAQANQTPKSVLQLLGAGQR